MKLTYKERQDILWSLEENAKRLGEMMAGFKNIEPAYEREGDQDGLKRVRDKYTEAHLSRERLWKLAERIDPALSRPTAEETTR